MVSSLPERPLTLTEVTALDENEATTFCAPLVAFRSETPTDDIIALYFATDSATKILGFTPGAGWDVLETLEQADDITTLEHSATSVIEWATDIHGSDSIVVLSGDNSNERLEEFLPPHPLGKRDLPGIKGLPQIDDVHPLFCYADSHEIIAILTFQFDPANPEGFMLANYAYHPDQQSWRQIEHAMVNGESTLDPGTDLTIHDWIEEHYNMDSVLAISPDPIPDT